MEYRLERTVSGHHRHLRAWNEDVDAGEIAFKVNNDTATIHYWRAQEPGAGLMLLREFIFDDEVFLLFQPSGELTWIEGPDVMSGNVRSNGLGAAPQLREKIQQVWDACVDEIRAWEAALQEAAA